ncbi:MAG: isochorismatase family protein [Arcanobacterium sp.]|nr:isochorismatase family protein [Arcanobacterium sp.]
MNDNNRALIIVDVQPTFCEGGALGVDGGNAVAEKIADFVTENADEYSFIVTTQDWHIKPGKHFSDHPDFVDTWPPHGVVGTPEAELHEAIASLPIDASVKKGQYAAAYSGFEGTDDDGESLEQLLRDQEIDALDIVGIAESHCVKDTALDGVRLGWPVRVFSDLTVPVSEELGVEARREMDEAGIDQLPSREAFGFYSEPDDQPIPGDDAFTDDFDRDDFESDSDVRDGDFASTDDDFADTASYADADDYDAEDDDADFEDFRDSEDFGDFGDSESVKAPGANLAGAGSIYGDDAEPKLPELGLAGSMWGEASGADLDDFDIDFDIDGALAEADDIDFSDEVDEADFDFSDINLDNELK